MEEFLVGAGLGLLLALLAWSDSITNLHKETIELEKDFSENRQLNLRRIRTIIRTELSPAKRITQLNELLNSAQLKGAEDIDIIDQLTILDSDRRSLERLYKIKYQLVIILTHLFLLSGIINYFIDDNSSFNIFCLSFKTEFISILSCILFLYIILLFIIHLNNVEHKYKEKIKTLMDRI